MCNNDLYFVELDTCMHFLFNRKVMDDNRTGWFYIYIYRLGVSIILLDLPSRSSGKIPDQFLPDR